MPIPQQPLGTGESHPKPRDLGKTIGALVIDADPMARVMIQLALERDGWEVWLAADRRQASDLFREHHEEIGLVVLDLYVHEEQGATGPGGASGPGGATGPGGSEGKKPGALVCFVY